MSYILIVEDDLAIVELLEQVLDDEGYATVSVGNGHAALDAIAASWPDCILLDLNLPFLDGEDVLRALATHYKRTAGPADDVRSSRPATRASRRRDGPHPEAVRPRPPLDGGGTGDTGVRASIGGRGRYLTPSGSSPPDQRSHS